MNIAGSVALVTGANQPPGRLLNQGRKCGSRRDRLSHAARSCAAAESLSRQTSHRQGQFVNRQSIRKADFRLRGERRNMP